MKELWLVTNMNKLINGGLVEIMMETLNEDLVYLQELQKDQIFAGQNEKGLRLAPSYFSDPFFKSPLAAAKYAKFKDKNDANIRKHNPIFAKKDFETPNLIVTGSLFHNHIFAKMLPDGIDFGSTGRIFGQLESKYPDLMGLNETAIDGYMRERKVAERIQDKIMKFIIGT